ncbi:MAG: chromate resistance protein [Actinomycetota bacterium]|nr:chromate resistance protein [Actinomycetota bacterium]
MRWVTRANCHIDRVACAWLIRRFVDVEAEFAFVEDRSALPTQAIAFDIPGVELSHHGPDCTFETMLRHYRLDDPVLWDVARIVHEADLADSRFDAPEAPGLDAVTRGLSFILDDPDLVRIGAVVFDGLYEYRRRSLLLGHDPS